MGRDPAGTAKTVLDIARQAELVFNHNGHYMEMLAFLGGLSGDRQMSKVRSRAGAPGRAPNDVNVS